MMTIALTLRQMTKDSSNITVNVRPALSRFSSWNRYKWNLTNLVLVYRQEKIENIESLPYT